MIFKRPLYLALALGLTAMPVATMAQHTSPSEKATLGEPLHYVFSKKYGDTWVRINFSRIPQHGWRVDQGQTMEGLGLTNAPIDLTSDAYLWCLVGDAKGFKLYNKAVGADYAVVSPAVTEGAALSLTSATKATMWTLDTLYLNSSTEAGYTLHPIGANKAFSPNSFGGTTGPVKYYTAADGGGRWHFTDASQRVQLRVELTTPATQLHPQTQSRVAQLPITLGSTTYTLTSKAGQTHELILGAGQKYAMGEPKAYRNYHFEGFDSPSPYNVTARFSVADTTAHYLFYNPDEAGVPPRIPAIATAKNGQLIAISDYRYCFGDIGMGDGRIDLIQRVSRDNGRTWSDIQTIAAHSTTDPMRRGYGDAAMVADRDRNEVLVMAVTGDISFWSSTPKHPMRCARLKGTYNETTQTWQYDAPQDLTESLYRTTFGDSLRAFFLTSGKLFQSRVIKTGKYYRIYGAFCVFEQTTGKKGTYVAYTDDFGQTWQQLGKGGMAAVHGDEAKCEEFPDGTVILSSRSGKRRIINTFAYDKGKKNIRAGRGNWLGQSFGITDTDSPNGTNGEIGIYDAIRTSDGKRVKIVLQSTPTNNRKDVCIYYKELTEADKNAENFAQKGWKRYQVSYGTSAYSTFDLLPDGRIGFYVEENDYNGGYDMVFLPLELSTITQGAYKMAKPKR